jgi:hypothetical protein
MADLLALSHPSSLDKDFCVKPNESTLITGCGLAFEKRFM